MTSNPRNNSPEKRDRFRIIYQQPGLWNSNTSRNPIALITFGETETELALSVFLGGSHFVAYDVQVTKATVLIWGQLLDSIKETHYDSISTFERWVALPHAVHPDTLWIETSATGFVIQLAKQVNPPSPFPKLGQSSNFKI